MWNKYKNKKSDNNKDVMKKANNNDDSDYMLTLYYLLYEIKDSEILWIVSTSEYIHELKDRVKTIFSSVEKYYIVSKEISYSEYNKKLKQFTKFIPNKNCVILYETRFSNN